MKENFAINDSTHPWGVDDNTYIIPLRSVSKFKHKTTDKTAQCGLIEFWIRSREFICFCMEEQKRIIVPPPPTKKKSNNRAIRAVHIEIG